MVTQWSVSPIIPQETEAPNDEMFPNKSELPQMV